jgi:bifunctional non-homologous end joining protein LigD
MATRRAGARARAPARQRLPPVPAGAIPRELKAVVLEVEGRRVALSNLQKVFWPKLGITKGDLLRYYLEVAPVLLPHVRDRAMVMRRYPDGAEGKSFFMKRAPEPRPDWIATCPIEHTEGKVLYPMVQDLASLLWLVNLGCIDLNQWYARCDAVDQPDYLHFDLDPGAKVSFAQVLEAALIVHEALEGLGLPSYAKTTGSRGVHVYVPIVRGPRQDDVWAFAKALSHELAARHAAVVTAEYATAKRPVNRVHLDYNQNAWGRTLASVYSVRPSPRAAVSMPVTWKEVARGFALEDFRLDNAPARIRRRGDLWAPLLASRRRARLDRFL